MSRQKQKEQAVLGEGFNPSVPYIIFSEQKFGPEPKGKDQEFGFFRKNVVLSKEAYGKFHSTKTALLKIHSDILASMDAGKVTALTLLDLYAAFDTIDHTILLSRLDDWFGVTGKALNWFK